MTLIPEVFFRNRWIVEEENQLKPANQTFKKEGVHLKPQATAGETA